MTHTLGQARRIVKVTAGAGEKATGSQAGIVGRVPASFDADPAAIVGGLLADRAYGLIISIVIVREHFTVVQRNHHPSTDHGLAIDPDVVMPRSWGPIQQVMVSSQ